MRLMGLILVTLGALALARQSVFTRAAEVPPSPAKITAQADELVVSPVLGGISVTSGLILVALGGRREDG